MGNLVIAKRKTTKHESLYDPKPYKVYKVYGAQIKAMREDGKQKTRDSQKWKKVDVQPRRSYKDVRSRYHESRYLEDTDIGAKYQGEEGRGPNTREQGQGAGLIEVVMAVVAGGTMGSIIEDRGAGLYSVVKDGTAGGATSSNPEDRGAGLDDTEKAGTAEGATGSDTEEEGLVIIVEDGGAGLVVIGEDEGAELIYEGED